MTRQSKPLYRCQSCGFTVFNRRYPNCESCGVALDPALLLSPKEQQQRDQALDRSLSNNARIGVQIPGGAADSPGSYGLCAWIEKPLSVANTPSQSAAETADDED